VDDQPLRARPINETREWEAKHPWFAPSHRGRSFYEAFSSSTEVNQAMTKGLLSAVKALIEARDAGFAAGAFSYGDPGAYALSNVTFYYPVVVLEGELFAVLGRGAAVVGAGGVDAR
jgi:hypothetical protein